MGDYKWQSKEAYETAMTNDKYLGYIQWENGILTGESILKDEAWEKYKIKIIEVKYAKPLVDNFK